MFPSRQPCLVISVNESLLFLLIVAKAGVCVKPLTSHDKDNKEEQKEQSKKVIDSPPPKENQTDQITESADNSTQQLTPDLQPSPPPDAPSGEPQLTIKDDPQYKEWFRKLKYGANREQLIIAMRGKGLDPDLLDNPDLPIGGEHKGLSAPPPIVDEQNLVEDFSSSSMSDNSAEFSDD